MEQEKYLPELMAEKHSLDSSFVHAMRLLAEGKRSTCGVIIAFISDPDHATDQRCGYSITGELAYQSDIQNAGH